jgi:hypothetical protein
VVDERAFRAARDGIAPLPCAFEKALLAGCAACGQAERHLLAERETVNCRDAAAQLRCGELRQAMRQHFAFVLKLVHPDQPAPHGKELKAQCGGLRGLAHAINGSDAVTDVQALVSAALRQAGSLDELPYAQIAPFVAQFNIRQRD